MNCVVGGVSILIYTLAVVILALPLSASFQEDFLQNDKLLSLFEDGNNAGFELIQFQDEKDFIDSFQNDSHISKLQIFNKTRTANHDHDLGMGITIQNPSPEDQAMIEEGYKVYGYNKYVSDLIPVDRPLPDPRNEWCVAPNRISKMLLPTSVIICTYNEALSVLIRTIESIVSRSPKHLLAEIILIDDFSDHDELKNNLEEALQYYSNVKLIRLPQREGLIRCRLHGSLLAQAPILTFLDSHIETFPGWLEPLLDKVTKNWRTIAVPVFHSIDPSTFTCKFSHKPLTSVGGFNWDLMFKFKSIDEWDLRDVKTPADPIPTPTMPGGFYSIHKDFFTYLGKYDQGFEIWGGENMELSFKAWMCGGRVEILPCSHITHLERKRSVYSRKTVGRNNARLAAVWLDEFAPFYFSRAGKKYQLPNYGDISSRLQLKKSLNCSSFEWYLNNIIPSMMNPKSALAYGEVRNINGLEEHFCLDSHEPVTVGHTPSTNQSLHFYCHGLDGNQFWYHTTIGEIRQEQKCLDYFGGENVVLFPCHNAGGNQEWEYHGDTGILLHVKSQYCLTMNEKVGKLEMRPCQGLRGQRWKFEVDTIHQRLNNFPFLSDPYNET